MARCGLLAIMFFHFILFLLGGSSQAEIIYQQEFGQTEDGQSLSDLGWQFQRGNIKVTHDAKLGDKCVDGKMATSGIDNMAFRNICRQSSEEKYVLTFSAWAYDNSNNSGFGFAKEEGGQVKILAGWFYSNGNWTFDVRGITELIAGQRDLIPRIWPDGTCQPVTCKIVVDAGGHWVWGSVKGENGEEYKTDVFELPYSNDDIINALMMLQDNRTGSGPIIIDDIVVESFLPPVEAKRLKPKRFKEPTIVEYSWTSADTKYIHDNVENMEKRSLDGVTVRVANPRFPHGTVLNGIGKGDAGWQVFQNIHLDRSVIEPAIKDLRTTMFSQFRSNYVCVVSYLNETKTMDWFDDTWWLNIIHNVKLLAEVAQKGGCEGFMFDPEEYGCYIWGYSSLQKDPIYKDRSYEEVRVKIRQRGREFMAAINSIYPGIRIYILHAWEDALSAVADDSDRLQDFHRGYVVAFLDGMLEASDANTVLVDGIEKGYYIEELEEFQIKAQRVRWYGSQISAVPELFLQKVRLGFGVWLDRNRTWDPVNIENNYWSPEQFEKIITNALIISDGFVWTYLERPTWWLDSPDGKLGGGIDFGTGAGDQERNKIIKYIPLSYWVAVENARKRAKAQWH